MNSNYKGLTITNKFKTYNYRGSARRLGRAYTIGVLAPAAERTFFDSVTHGISNTANTNGCRMLLYRSHGPQSGMKAVELFISAKVDGILASVDNETLDFSYYLELMNSGIPVVFIGNPKVLVNIPSVQMDNFKGAYMATQHLIKQGYQRIGHISGPQHVKMFEDRSNGYKSALQDSDYAFDESLTFSGNVSVNAGIEAMNYFFNLDKKPDAIFAVEDFTALGVIKAAKIMNIDIPQELGVIGFANESFGEHITPGLSSMDQQSGKMGEEAFNLLLKLMGHNGMEQEKVKIIIDPLPRLRESSSKKHREMV